MMVNIDVAMVHQPDHATSKQTREAWFGNWINSIV